MKFFMLSHPNTLNFKFFKIIEHFYVLIGTQDFFSHLKQHIVFFKNMLIQQRNVFFHSFLKFSSIDAA